MKRSLVPKLSYSNVLATVALFIALGGVAVAAGLPKNSVGPNQLKKGAVTAAKIRKQAVTSGKIATGAVISGKLGVNAVTPNNIGNGAVTSAKIGANAVLATAIKNGVVTGNKLSNEAVTASKLAKESVTIGKLGPEVAPLLGTLKSGQTLRGVFDIGGEGKLARNGVSFQFPLANPPAAPEVNILAGNAASGACPGLKGSNGQTPEAAAGQLCVYISSTGGEEPKLTFDAGSVSRLGFGLAASFKNVDPANLIQGYWAVTAP